MLPQQHHRLRRHRSSCLHAIIVYTTPECAPVKLNAVLARRLRFIYQHRHLSPEQIVHDEFYPPRPLPPHPCPVPITRAESPSPITRDPTPSLQTCNPEPNRRTWVKRIRIVLLQIKRGGRCREVCNPRRHTNPHRLDSVPRRPVSRLIDRDYERVCV